MSTIAPAVATNARAVPGADTLAGAARLFTRFPTPRILFAQILFLAVVRVEVGPIMRGDIVIVGAVAAVWPLMEWFLHARVLHLRPRVLLGVTIDPLFARYHRYHHRNPWILERTFLPVPVLVPLVPVNLALFWLVTPSVELAVTGALSMGVAALVYEWTHFLTHTPYRPRSRFYAWIHRNHMLHHFKSERHWFAFTGPWLDRALGTGPDAASVPTSETARTLGVDESFD